MKGTKGVPSHPNRRRKTLNSSTHGAIGKLKARIEAAVVGDMWVVEITGDIV